MKRSACRPAIPTRFFSDRRNCKPLRLGAGDDTVSAGKLWQATKLHRRGSGRRFMQYAATASYCIEISRHFYRTSRNCLNSGRIQAISSVPCQTSWIIYANPDITPVLHWAGRLADNRIVESVEAGRSGGLLAPAACDAEQNVIAADGMVVRSSMEMACSALKFHPEGENFSEEGQFHKQ